MENNKYLVELMQRATPAFLMEVIGQHFRLLSSDYRFSDNTLSLGDCGDMELIALNQWAQRIILLVKHRDSSVLQSIWNHFSPEDQIEFARTRNEYDRILWACQNYPILFDEACRSLVSLEVFDTRSSLPCTMFHIQENVNILGSNEALQKFKESLQSTLWVENTEIAVSCDSFIEEEQGTTSAIHDLCVQYNNLPTSILRVENHVAVRENIKIAGELHLVYHENDGVLEVYAEESISRKRLAGLFCTHLLGIESLPIKLSFDYQHLAVNDELPLINKYIFSAIVKKVELSGDCIAPQYRSENEHDDDFEQGKFDHSNTSVSSLTIELETMREKFPPYRTLIEFKGEDVVFISALHHGDRWRCHKLLSEWRLLSGERYANRLN